MGQVREYALMAEKLEARERMEAITDTAAGSGSLEKHALQRHFRDLQRFADGPAAPRAEKSGPTLREVEQVGVGVNITRKGGDDG